MVQPSKQWKQRQGYIKKEQRREHLLSGSDDIFSGALKLAQGVPEAEGIILQMCRQRPGADFLVLLDMDDMQMYGHKIIKAYHEWARNDYEKLFNGIRGRDESLLRAIA